MHRIILRLVEEITNHLVSSNLPLLYENTQFHISNKQFHIFFQILRCSKMNQDEEPQNVATRAIEDGADFWKVEDEVEDSTFGEEDDNLKHIARSMLELLPDFRKTQTQAKSKKYACQDCDYSTTQNGHLRRHWTAKHTQERFKCDLCGSTFTIANTLSRHIASKHNGLTFKCAVDECSYTALCSYQLLKIIGIANIDIGNFPSGLYIILNESSLF